MLVKGRGITRCREVDHLNILIFSIKRHFYQSFPSFLRFNASYNAFKEKDMANIFEQK